jgi:dihydrofolate reductase
MRKIAAGLFISLDGVVEDPHLWHFPYFNDEMGAAVTATLGRSDTVLLGRKTYDSFAGAWPDREAAGGEDAGMAKSLGDARKIVCRTSSCSSRGGTPSSCGVTWSKPSPP